MVTISVEFVDAEAITHPLPSLTDAGDVLRAMMRTASWPDRVVRAVKVDGADLDEYGKTELQFELAQALCALFDHERLDERLRLMEMVTFT